MLQSGLSRVPDSQRTLWRPGVFWQPVGSVDDEIVVMREPPDSTAGSTVAAFVVRRQLAAAWWSRMDGGADHTDKHLVESAAEACSIPRSTAQELFDRFAGVLVDRGLVERGATAHAQAAPHTREYAFPSAADEALLEPLDLGAMVDKDLVALGTFVGGTSNVSTLNPCTGQSGGIQNAQTSGTCIPGPNFGFFNFGWYGRPC